MFKSLKKEVNKDILCLKKDAAILKKDEEKVVVEIFGFKLKKKLLFSILLGALVFVVGLGKIDSMHKSGHSTSGFVLLLSIIFCGFFLWLMVIRKNYKHYLKQFVCVFAAITIILGVFMFLMNYAVYDILFVSLIITTVSLSVYDVL